ncbi:MAG: FeS-binding protein [Alphaproteobacteria bacterium CG_4_10_14_0_2_um_filter_63_37]|nr:MAG: FeS-binding protein [Proteobacteria bacterium CG1_02_64_396]PJA24001.1 MAG: FeS-binding protein [Alphaproteobacteria bacterium CG_4_10_14_0_2_um_filter_63_37]
MNKKIYLTFPPEQISEPVIYNIGHKFEVVTNIRTASISPQVGVVGLELSGEPDQIEAAIAYIESLGILVEPIELDVIEG